MEDSDDADEGGASRNPEVLTASGREPVRSSDVEAATRYINSMGSAGRSWVARHLHRQAAPSVGGSLGFTFFTVFVNGGQVNTKILGRYLSFSSIGVL